MTGRLRLSILLLHTLWVGLSLEQHSPYSLQTAVDALHRREAQLALKDSDFNPAHRYYQDERYWVDDDSEIPTNRINKLKLNRLLARYLAREDENDGGSLRRYGINGQYDNNDFEEDENYLPEEKKRSVFRERDEEYEPPYQTLFRERELGAYQPDLTEEFLREIEEKKELEQEEKYKEQVRRLWEKYQQEENEIEEELFDEQQKRRHPMANNIGPYYAGPPMERKRQYPVLPWLPVSKKKRFPVTKRSPKPLAAEDSNTSGTDEKVAKDLQAIFGNTDSAKALIDSKKKRSTNNEETPKDDKSTNAPMQESKKSNSPDNAITGNAASSHKHDEHQHEHHHQHQSHDHHHHHQGHENDSAEHASDEDESSEEHDHEHEHDQDEDEDDHDFDDEDDDDRKKKRDVSSSTQPSSVTNKKSTNLEVIREDQIIPGDLTDFRKKKAIQWSKYFGIDRRKKSAPWYMGSDNNRNEELNMRKDFDNEEKHPKHEINPEKLENMDKKLKTIEDLIIDETIKYTGAHEGISDPEEIQQLKDHVVSRLATAYSLEKMRLALEKLRESIDNENHLQKNQIEYEANNSNNNKNNSANKDAAKDKEKRVAVKKEKAELNGNQHSTESLSRSEKFNPGRSVNNLEDSSSILPPLDEKKRKRKRTGIPRYASDMPNDINDFEEELGAGHFEPLNENLGITRTLNIASGEQMQCPILDSMADRCRGVDILSGDIHQELLSVCGIHQLCYLCGTSQIACDFQYLSEADSVCGRNSACQSAARSALMILRGSPGPQFGPKECLKNPCLYRAMREIGL